MPRASSTVVSAVLPVKLACDGSLEQEWRMVELQGTLLIKGAHKSDEEQLAGYGLGELSYEGGFPVLKIGAHKLEGKETLMKRPLAVLSKLRGNATDTTNKGDNNISSSTEYQVIGQVKSKIVFKTRPKPIIEQTEQQAKQALKQAIADKKESRNNKRKEAPCVASTDKQVETNETDSANKKVAHAVS